MAAATRRPHGRFDAEVDEQVEQLAATGLATRSLSRAISQVGAPHAAAAVAGREPFAVLCRELAAAARGEVRDGWTILAACPPDQVVGRLAVAGIHVRRPDPPTRRPARTKRDERPAPPAARRAA